MTYDEVIENMARAIYDADPLTAYPFEKPHTVYEQNKVEEAIQQAKAAFKAIEDAGCVVVDPKNIEIGSIDKSIFNELVKAGKIGGA